MRGKILRNREVVLYKNFFILILIFSLDVITVAQNDTRILDFRGGTINYKMTFYSGMLNGLGSRTMGTNSSLENYGAESIFWNPAGLAKARKAQVFVDYAPPVSLKPDRFYDFQDKANRMADNEFKSKSVAGTPYKQPVLSTEFESGTRMQSFGFVVPWKNYSFAAAYFNSFEINMNMLESGFHAFFKQGDEATPEEIIAFRVSGDFSADFNLNAETVSFAGAYQLQDDLSLGITFDYYTISAKLKADVNFYGSVSIGGGTAVLFNDPSQGYPNSLFSSFEGKFAGSNWGIRLGGSWRLTEKSEIALTANIPFTVQMDGNLDIENNTPLFYSGGNIDKERLNISETTRTKKVLYHSDGMDIRLPGSLIAGYSYALDGVTLIANAGFNFNELSFKYAYFETNTEDSTAVLRSYRQGIKPGAEVKLGIDFGMLKIGTGAIFANEIKKGFKDGGNKASLIIPLFSLAFNFPLDDHFRIDGNLISVAMPFSRISISYIF